MAERARPHSGFTVAGIHLSDELAEVPLGKIHLAAGQPLNAVDQLLYQTSVAMFVRGEVLVSNGGTGDH